MQFDMNHNHLTVTALDNQPQLCTKAKLKSVLCLIQSFSSLEAELFRIPLGTRGQTLHTTMLLLLTSQSPLSAPPVAGVLALVSLSISACVRLKEKRSKSSARCLGLELFGTTGMPCCTAHFKATCG